MLYPVRSRQHRPLQITYTNLGEKQGRPRFWIEGLRLEKANLTKGRNLKVETHPELSMLSIEGVDRETSHTVSGRKRNNSDTVDPIVDINSQKILSPVFEKNQLLRVMVFNNKLIVQAHPRELNAVVALDDLRANVRSKNLTTSSMCVGGGICSNAIKQGMNNVGFSTSTEWVVDIANEYLQSLLDNTEVADDSTIVVEGSMGDIEPNLLPPSNILNISLPCTPYSKSAPKYSTIAGNKISEAHPEAQPILKAIGVIENGGYPVITSENVVEFMNSGAYALLEVKLKELGYDVQWRKLGGFGTLENRQRAIMVASHPALNLDMDQLVPVLEKESCIGDILEDIPLDSSLWKSYSHLFAKAKKDADAGKNFKMQILDGTESTCGVMGWGYFKGRSTEPFLRHPENPKLMRAFTETEQAALMKIPADLVGGLSRTRASQILGQSGSYALFTAIGEWLGKQLDRAVAMHDGLIPTIEPVDIHRAQAKFVQSMQQELAEEARINSEGLDSMSANDDNSECQMEMWS